jgi:glycolate oxidase FAD binding subunit
MPVSAGALHDALADIAGREHVLGDGPRLAGYAVDGMVPAAVIRPDTAEQVGRVLGLCAAERLAVVPRGSGSSLGLGNPPRRLDLVLDLGRLRAVREYVPEDMVATVEAGLTLAALSAHLAPQRQMLALDPPGGDARSVGGVLATHASGPLRFRYGTGRDLLLGARFAQVDGALTWGGAKVVKSVTGYDVPKLLVGSLGTLGVLVEVTLRLHPIPPTRRSWRLGFPSHAAAGAFLAALLDSPLQPERAALIDAAGLGRMGLASDPMALLVSIGGVAEAVEIQGQALARLAAGHEGRGEPLAEAAWSGLGLALDGSVLLRAACEPQRLVHWAAETQAGARRIGVEVVLVGQPGDGVLQVSLPGSGDPEAIGRDLALPLRRALEAEEGSLVVERGPLELKMVCEAWGSIDRENLAIMERIKLEFDPHRLLSPGRFVGGL